MLLSPLFVRLKNHFEQWMRPAAVLTEPEQAQQARLLASLSLALLLLAPILSLIWVVTMPEFVAAPYITLAMLLGMALAYGLSRTRAYRKGAIILIGTFLALVIALLFVSPSPMTERMLALNYLIVIHTLAILFLRRGETWLLTAVSLALISAFFFIPEVPAAYAFAYLTFYLLFTSLQMIGAALGQRDKQQLSEGMTLHSSLVAAMAEGVVVQRADGAILSCNEAAERILGLTVDQMMGRTSVDPQWRSIHEDGSPFPGETHPAMVTLRTGEPLQNVVMGVHQPGGALRWLAINSQPLTRTGEALPYAVVTTFRDITERKQRERDLLEARQRYYALFEQAHDAVFILDLNGRHLEANQRAADMMGYSVEEIQHLSAQELSAQPEQSASKLQQLLTKEHLPIYERTFKKKDGTLVEVEINLELVRDLEGNPLHIQSVVRDITGRKTAEAALRAQHDELDRFFTVSLDLLCIADVNGRFLKTNKAWESTLGYTTEDLVGQLTLDFVHPDDRQSTLDAFATLSAQQPILNFTNRYRTKVGDYRLIEWRSYPIGNLIYAAARDITERHQAEESLRQSEARWRAMLSAIPDLIFRNRADGVFLDYHAREPERLSMLLEQLLGRKMTDVRPGALANKQVALIQQVAETGQMALHEYSVPTQGGALHFEARIVPIGDSKEEVLTIVRDVTSLRQAQQQLAEAQARSEFAVEAARLAWWELDLATGRVQFDPRKVLMAGYAPEAFANATYHAFTDLVHPDDYEPMMQAMGQVAAGQTTIYETDYRMKTAVGGWLWFHDHGELLVDENGRRIVRGYVIDITARKEAEQREIDLRMERERVRMLTDFIQSASHEFRNPLAIINTTAFIMARLPDAEARQSKVTLIQDQVNRITRLLNTLLTIVRLETQTSLLRETLDLNEIFELTCHKLSQDPTRRPLVHCQRANPLPPVLGDADSLREAVRQIVDNALRYTPDGGKIALTCGAADGNVWLEVRDTGPGIPEEDRARIFETFWREDAAHSTPGFGLGLTIARKIIALHGGKIEVESEVNVGSVFRVVLPAAPSEER
jgi:PAS domain S-box-containing protein